MNTVNEIKNYFNEENSVGALLLTGKWGCGKTYLLEHDLIEQLSQADYLVIHVSLFGLNAICDIHNTIKREYASKYHFKNDDTKRKASKVGKFFKALGSVAENLHGAAGIVGSISANWLDFVEVESETDNKDGEKKRKTVLILDDLERSNIDIQELLGAINEYVERKSIKTLLVANEEIIRDKAEEYEVLKEKVISRTISHYPNYDKIIDTIIERYQSSRAEYKLFLNENCLQIKDIFKYIETYNIRILLFSLQDFESLY